MTLVDWMHQRGDRLRRIRALPIEQQAKARAVHALLHRCILAASIIVEDGGPDAIPMGWIEAVAALPDRKLMRRQPLEWRRSIEEPLDALLKQQEALPCTPR